MEHSLRLCLFVSKAALQSGLHLDQEKGGRTCENRPRKVQRATEVAGSSQHQEGQLFKSAQRKFFVEKCSTDLWHYVSGMSLFKKGRQAGNFASLAAGAAAVQSLRSGHPVSVTCVAPTRGP